MKKLLLTISVVLLTTAGVVQAKNTAHDTLQYIISTKPILQGMPISVTDPFAVILQVGNEFALGITDNQSKRIFISNEAPYFMMKHIALHEAGHLLFNSSPEALQLSYCRAFADNGKSVSRYGRTNCHENFAEMFAFYNGSRYHCYSGVDEYIQGSPQLQIVEYITNKRLNLINN